MTGFQGAAWHSDHYTDGRGAGDVFKRLWLDALAEHPDGLSVPQVVKWVLRREDKHVGLESWCLSYGEEQALRGSADDGSLASRYWEAVGRLAEEDEWSDRDWFEAVLTERLHHYARRMANPHVGVLAPTGRVQTLNISTLFQLLNGASPRGRGRAVIYVRGPKPLKVRQTGKGYAIYDPTQTDWDIVWNRAEAEAVHLLNDGRTSPRVRRVLAQMIRARWKDERPEPLTFVTRPLEDET